MVTNDTFVSFLHCKRKAFLVSADTPGELPNAETVFLAQERLYLQRALGTYLARFPEQEVLHNPQCVAAILKSAPRVIVNMIASGDGLSSAINAAERTKQKKPSGTSVYAPVHFTSNEKVSRADKLLLVFNALALSSVQGMLPSTGTIVHGAACKVLNCRIEPLVAEVRRIVAQIQAARADGAQAPGVTLNRHCNRCAFRADCERIATQLDDLSLLRGLSAQDIERQRNRGVTTVAQFAGTFRPGRRGKRKAGKDRKHDHALQAVALRDRKVYVLDSPTIPSSRVSLYLDIEGIPDQGFDYLIGLVAVVGDRTTAHFFWADDRDQEKAIWDACKHVINTFEDYTLFHYGQYELRFLDRMQKLAGADGAAEIDRIRARSCNVLAAIYSHIYFPTRSNGLKDIATLLGATWTATTASGIQSLAWRQAWEAGRSEAIKQQLLQYNREDCIALRRVTEFIRSICEGAPAQLPDGETSVGSAKFLNSSRGSKIGNTVFFCPEMDQINKCAYSDYQRERVYLRTSPAVRKSLRRKERASKRHLRVNTEIALCAPDVCPLCGGTNIQKGLGRYRKVVLDLKFSSSGVKRWIVRYSTRKYRCMNCRNLLVAPEYRLLRFHLGDNLCSWAVYHHVAHRQSGADIAMSLNDLFGFSFKRNFLTQIMPLFSKRHQATYDRIKEKLRQGQLIHADETKGVVKTHSGYVWVFTNLEEVVYTYNPTREGNVLTEMLKGFDGVLVSDFYSVYDTAKCRQQKCLIHLMRDINDDVFHNPFDEELKQIARRFVAVLKPIIDTIDKSGLRQYFLKRHKDDVTCFFTYLSEQLFGSEVAQRYQTRMQKCQEKLFTFLDYDGVPWNNNNAENAVKPFASRRKIIQAAFSARGLQNYLIFLSISQTCRNKHMSFLRFLRSGKLDIDAFADAADG